MQPLNLSVRERNVKERLKGSVIVFVTDLGFDSDFGFSRLMTCLELHSLH